MSSQTPFERLGRELELAARREIEARERRARPRGRRGRRGAALALAATLLVGAAAAAWAATSLLSSGSPVPFVRGVPVPGRAEGAPVPGSVRLLADAIPDPVGGAPWGLRYWRTDRGFGCIQAGRVFHRQLGQITDNKVFHELRVGVTRGALGGCFMLDGSGHAFVAMHLDAMPGGQPIPCPLPISSATMRPPPFPGCGHRERTIDLGLLGPHANRYTYRLGGRLRQATPLADVGAYLIVQPHLEPVVREFGFHHRDPRLNLRGPAEPYLAVTPGSQVITRVDYDAGVCRTHVTGDERGSCYALAGYAPIPQPRVGDVATRVHAFLAPSGRAIRVRFRARQAVSDGRSGYAIEIRPARGGNFLTMDYAHDVQAGELVHTTVPRFGRGPYRIVVRYRTVQARPGPAARPAYPGALVGEARVLVP